MESQESELLGHFRQLSPASQSTVLTAVSMAVSAEAAVRLEIQKNVESSQTADGEKTQPPEVTN